jgi:hypothetical protein
LGEGDVACLTHESLEPLVGDLEPVHPEALNGHTVRGRLLRVVAVRAHQELAPRYPHHVAVRWLTGRLDRSGDEALVSSH